MRATSILLSTCLALFLAAADSRAQERHVHRGSAEVAGLGSVVFANSGNADAQPPFLRGLALLHSFEYDKAAEAFRAAQQADPAFALAYWGEAVTYAHLLWGEDDVDAARQALNRLAVSREARLAKAPTPRERAYGTAVEALFADAALPVRVRGFADSMRTLTAAYPDDLDGAAFTSLALQFAAYVGQLPAEERRKVRDEAITFAQRVFAANPQHPGGTHYLIHATDDPELAPRGLEAARRYAAIAPNSEHALHMPSHIFVQLGLWDDAVASNERAWAASRSDVAARKASNAELSFHSLEWLQYAYLQLGRYEASRKTIQTARDVLTGVDLADARHADPRYTLSRLQFQHALATGDWSGDVCRERSDAAAAPLGPSADRERTMRNLARYQADVSAVLCGRGAAAIDAVRARIAKLPENDPDGPLLRATLRHAQLLAYIGGQPAEDLDALLADPSPPSRAAIGPPATLRTEELLGQARLKAGRPREAVAAYERALQLTPNRTAVWLGLARARKAAGDARGSAEAYARLLENWRNADSAPAAMQEARENATPKASR